MKICPEKFLFIYLPFLFWDIFFSFFLTYILQFICTLMPQIWWSCFFLRYILQFTCTIYIPRFTGLSCETDVSVIWDLLFIFDCFIVLWNCRYVPSELDYYDDFVDSHSFLSWNKWLSPLGSSSDGRYCFNDIEAF